jgi:3-oxoadipate enol-lactonase
MGTTMTERLIASADGTRLATWCNDGHGIPVVISNGLGTPVEAWPSITRYTDHYRVVSWNHRGLGGSERPADESRIGIAAHAEDLMAVMDAYDMPRCAVIGWSVGVSVAFEVMRREPDRIAAVLAVAGVPGGTFSALLHPLPKVLRPRAGRIGSHLLRYVGPGLRRLADGLPAPANGGFDITSLSTLGLDAAHANTVLHVVRTFARHDWGWYSKLAKASGEHSEVDLATVAVPVTFLSGRWDSITSADSMREASQQVAGSRYLELRGTHYVPLQFPAVMAAEFRALLALSDLGAATLG